VNAVTVAQLTETPGILRHTGAIEVTIIVNAVAIPARNKWGAGSEAAAGGALYAIERTDVYVGWFYPQPLSL
jgi:hypothetical protein